MCDRDKTLCLYCRAVYCRATGRASRGEACVCGHRLSESSVGFGTLQGMFILKDMVKSCVRGGQCIRAQADIGATMWQPTSSL